MAAVSELHTTAIDGVPCISAPASTRPTCASSWLRDAQRLNGAAFRWRSRCRRGRRAARSERLDGARLHTPEAAWLKARTAAITRTSTGSTRGGTGRTRRFSPFQIAYL